MQLFEEKQISVITEDGNVTIKIKNVCPFRHVIMGREDIEFGRIICQFSSEYFESALKILANYNVRYA